MFLECLEQRDSLPSEMLQVGYGFTLRGFDFRLVPSHSLPFGDPGVRRDGAA